VQKASHATARPLSPKVWLDNQHLSLANTVPRPVPRPGPSAGPLALEPSLVLDSVCWLEVAGEITGVLPGTYQVEWPTRFWVVVVCLRVGGLGRCWGLRDTKDARTKST
jgi:hypothetical protein